MSWFKRITKGITTRTREKREAPDGLWHRCAACKKTYLNEELINNLNVCPYCMKHERIGSAEYFDIIFDNQEYTFLHEDIMAKDLLEFYDLKSYKKRLEEAKAKTNLKDSMRLAAGDCESYPLTVACMDFSFIGGSMGSVVGEKIARGVDFAIKNRTAFMIISKSGGARMQESAFSLMQMAKASAKLSQLAAARLPYISLMTDPTTGGVTASYAMLGDINIAEPKALIGFAGPRVIKETIKKELPKGFQTSEFLLEHGFLDFIVMRKDLKSKLGVILKHILH